MEEGKGRTIQGTPGGKRLGHKKIKIMKSKTLHSSGGSGKDAASLSLYKFNDMEPSTLPTGH